MNTRNLPQALASQSRYFVFPGSHALAALVGRLPQKMPVGLRVGAHLCGKLSSSVARRLESSEPRASHPAQPRWYSSFLTTFLDCRLTPHLMTLSARASTLGGIVRPICLAAF